MVAGVTTFIRILLGTLAACSAAAAGLMIAERIWLLVPLFVAITIVVAITAGTLDTHEEAD